MISFLTLAFGITWLFWLPTAVVGSRVTSSAWLIPYLLGGFGPSAAGLILAARQNEGKGVRDLWRRLVDWRRISAGWYILILLIMPLVITAVSLIAGVFGLESAGFAALAQIQANPAVLIGMLLLGIFTGPLAEELGWRGYALDRLQARWSPLAASLILAPIHWAWHLPLFFIEGSTQADWGFFSLDSLFFFLALVPLTLLMTWVYNHNQRSVLAAVLLHFSYNFTLGLVFPMPADFQFAYFLVFSAMTIAVILATNVGRPRRA